MNTLISGLTCWHRISGHLVVTEEAIVDIHYRPLDEQGKCTTSDFQADALVQLMACQAAELVLQLYQLLRNQLCNFVERFTRSAAIVSALALKNGRITVKLTRREGSLSLL